MYSYTTRGRDVCARIAREKAAWISIDQCDKDSTRSAFFGMAVTFMGVYGVIFWVMGLQQSQYHFDKLL